MGKHVTEQLRQLILIKHSSRKFEEFMQWQWFVGG